MSQSIEQKQKYLCDQIIQQGFDAEEFGEYCLRIMGNMDIESWTFAELQNIVAVFVETKRSTEHENHETSFMQYQQDDNVKAAEHEKPQIQTTPAKMAKQPPKEEFSQLKPDVQQLWSDPFSKKEKSMMSSSSVDWTNGAWNTGNKPSATLPNKEFNFMDLLQPTPPITASPARTHATGTVSLGNSPMPASITIKQPETKPQPKPIQQFQPIKVESKPPQSFQDLFSKSNSMRPVNPPMPNSYVGVVPNQPAPPPTHPPAQQPSKTVGNLNIFDMSIDDLPSTTTHRSQPPQPVPVHQNKHSEPKRHQQAPVRLQSSTVSNLASSAVVMQNVNQDRAKSQSRMKSSSLARSPDDFFDMLPCAKANPRSLLNTSNIQVIITGHQIVNRNFFVPDYVLYHIHTKGINVQVKRKYNHFLRLRNMLAKFYPGYRVPYLQKNPWLNETDIEFIKKQKVMIQFFMNDILMNRQFRNCRIVEEFLTLDYKKLKAKLQEYDKLARLKALEELCLLPGQINVAFSDQHRYYCDGVHNFASTMSHHFGKYMKLQDQLASNYAHLLKTYGQMNELMLMMEATCRGFNTSVSIGQFANLEKSINNINQIYHEMAEGIKFDMKILEFEHKPIIKFQKQNMLTMKELLEVRNKMADSFVKVADRATEPYLNNPRLDAFKAGVEEPSKHPTILKYQAGFYTSQTVSENMRTFMDLSKKLNYKVAQIATQYEERAAVEMVFWNNKRMVLTQ